MGRKANGDPQARWGEPSLWLQSPRPGYVVVRGRMVKDGRAFNASAAVTPARTEKQARAFVRETLLTKAATGAEQVDRAAKERARRTLAQQVPFWLEAKASTRPASLDSYRVSIDRATAFLGKHRLAELEPEHVRAWWRWLAEHERLTPANVHKHHVVLRVFLNDAWRERLPVGEHTRKMRPPPTTHHDAPVATGAHIANLFEATAGDGQWGVLWMLLADTGERRGEASGHQWHDLDEINGTLRLVRQIDHKTLAPKEIKNPKRRRTIPLAPETLAALKEHRKAEQAAGFGKPGDYLFHSSTGHQLAPSTIARAWKLARAKAKLPDDLVPHSLRHGHATGLLESGVDLYTISRRLGHSGIGITSAVYVHRVEALEREGAERTAKRVRKKG